jgi:hypothetical protein
VARQLAGTLRGLSRHLTGYVEKSSATLAVTTTRELRQATPKDTRWSSVNWEPSVGRSSVPGVLDSVSVARELKLALVPSELVQQEAAMSALTRFGGYRLGQGKIYVTNHVHYIQKLADGYSLQASSGWIPRTIHEAIAKTYVIMRAR